MRLNPFNTGNINVSSSGGGGLPGGKAGGLGCGTIILAAIGYFVFGLDPMQTAATVESVQQQSGSGSQTVNTNEQEVCTASQYATEACNALDSLNTTWSRPCAFSPTASVPKAAAAQRLLPAPSTVRRIRPSISIRVSTTRSSASLARAAISRAIT